MTYKWKKILAIASVITAFNVFAQGSASAVSFNFTQAGWTAGGIVTGSFEGEDLNGDSIISEIEVSNFSSSWSGNSVVPALNFTDVDDWQFSLSQGQLISGFTSQATSVWSYDLKSGSGSIGIGGFVGTIGDTTEQPPIFTLVNTQSVPEPSSVGASVVALGGVLLSKKLRREKHLTEKN